MTLQRTALTLEARTAEGPDRYQFTTTGGLCSTESFRTSELRLLDALWDREVDRLLCPQANYGVVGVVAAHAGAQVSMTETSARARNCCERNAAANDATATTELVADLTVLDETFDAVAYAPREYTPIPIGKQRIADSLAQLEPGGQFFLAGSAQSGQYRYEACLEQLTGGVETVLERDGTAVVVGTRPSTVDTPSYVSPRKLNPCIDGTQLSLVSVPGLFSASEHDHGTRLLAETARIGDSDRILDLCCGYGALGTYAAKTTDADVWLTDDDGVATRCAARSVDASGVEATVVTGDGVAPVADCQFDAILCNPPTHAGSGVLSDVLGGAHEVLASGGELWVVHHRSLDLSDHLRCFAGVETVETGSEHVVIRADG